MISLYFITTKDHYEDYFVAAPTITEAKQYFADGDEYDIEEVSASKVSNLTIKETKTRYVQLADLVELGFTVINEAHPTIVRYESRLFKYDLGMQMALINSCSRTDCVYFLQVCGTKKFKIGITNNIQKRLGNIRTGNPDAIKVIALLKCKNTHEIESILHEEFKKHRIHGEWFDLENAQVSSIIQRMQSFEDRQSITFTSISIGDIIGL